MNKLLVDTSASLCDEFTQVIREGNAFISNKQWDKAEAAARKALSYDSASATAHEILFVAVISSDHPEKFVDVIDSAVSNCASEPAFARLGFVLAGASNVDARNLYNKALAKWPDGTLVAHLHGVVGQLKQSTKPVNKPRANNKRPNSIGAEAFRLAIHEDKKTALSFLNESIASPNKVVANRAMQVSRIVQHIPNKASFQRPLVVDEGAELTHSQKTSSGTTVVFFSGMGIDLEHNYELIDSYFSAAGASSVFLRDRSLNAFVRGLNSIADNRADTLSSLKSLFTDLGTIRLICVGRSVGGYGALQYGLALEADRIVNFSGATDLRKQFWDAISDNRGRLVVDRLNAENLESDLSLSIVLSKANLISEGVHMYYGDAEEYDTAHAEHISAVSKNIKLHPVQNFSSHHTFHHFLENGQFYQKIAE